jgi:multicomponent Na+:H+ antiporter subunit G
MTAMIEEGLVLALAVGGTAFVVVAAVGLVRLPDLYCRAHALGKAMTLGLILLLLALWVELGAAQAGLVLPLAILFQLLTIPVGGHLLCRLAKRRSLPQWRPEAESKG